MIRYINYDILRLVATLSVILIHIISIYNLGKFYDFSDFNLYFFDILNKCIYWCVPIFFMLSGALLLGNEKEDLITFYKKRLNKIFIPTIFWSLFFLIYLFLYEGFSLFNMIGAFLKGKPYYHLWFMFAILGLYVFTPFIRILVQKLEQNNFRILLILLFIFSMGDSFLSQFLQSSSNLFSTFIGYIGYFILGFYIKKFGLTLPKYLTGIYVFYILTITFAILAYISKYKIGLNLSILSYHSPLILLESLILYLYINSKKIICKNQKNLFVLSDLTFGVYLIHPFFIILLKPYFSVDYMEYMFLFFILTTFFSFLSVFIIKKIKYINRIV